MNAIIIDDDATSTLVIKKFCKKYEHINILADFPNPIPAISFLEKNQIDLIFLDIHMPELNGIDFLKQVSKLPFVVIITSDRNFALEAFEYHVSDYLVKPLDFERFSITIERVNNMIAVIDKTTHEEIYIHIDKRLIRIKLDSISYVEAKGDYALIHTDEKNYIVHSTMKNMERRLPQDKFLKVHRSFIINVDQIGDIQDNMISLGKNQIPLSKANKERLKEKLNLL